MSFLAVGWRNLTPGARDGSSKSTKLPKTVHTSRMIRSGAGASNITPSFLKFFMVSLAISEEVEARGVAMTPTA